MGGMRPGDMVGLRDDSILPTLDIGKFMGPRLDVDTGRVGLVLRVESFWAEDWALVLFPAGLGWIKDEWGSVVQRCGP